VNFTDPSGMYHSEVHLGLTRSLVKQVNPGLAELRNPYNPTQTLADVIAEADQHVDAILSTLNSGACFECHFNSIWATLEHVNTAINSKNLVLFGASLHQLQDYFSHWREGYQVSPGHAIDTIRSHRSQDRLDDFFYGGHYMEGNPPYQKEKTWISSPYPAHERGIVISDILYRNPRLTRSDFTDDNLIINLYLRRDPGVSNTYQSSEQRMKERRWFGIGPDLYVANSSRDTTMRNTIRYNIWLFFLGFKNYDPCDIWEADDLQILGLLTN
jgi:hypothetical protein